MAKTDIVFEIIADNTELVKQACEEQILKALEACGMEAENYAKINITRNQNVDTGLLRNSITYCVAGDTPHISSYKADRPLKSGKTESGSYSGVHGDKNEMAVYVGTNVSYGPYIEIGTSRNHGPYPFLKPAIADHIDHYNEIIKRVLSR